MPLFLNIPLSEVWVHSPGAAGAGQGTGSQDKVRRYTVALVNTGTAITYADSSSLGGTFTINETGFYMIHRGEYRTGGSFAAGVSVNSNQLSTGIASITAAHRTPITSYGSGASVVGVDGDVVFLTAGDVIRAHDSTTVTNGTTFESFLRIMRVA